MHATVAISLKANKLVRFQNIWTCFQNISKYLIDATNLYSRISEHELRLKASK